MNGHKLQSIKVQRVALVPHPCSDEPVLLYVGEEKQAIGCEVCGAPYCEVLQVQCPEELKLSVVKDG